MWNYIRNLYYLWFVPKHDRVDKKVELEDRERLVEKILLELFGDEPFVSGGKFSWFKLPGDTDFRKISFLFLEIPLCIQVNGPGISSINLKSSQIIDEDSGDQQAILFLKDVCDQNGITLIEILWNADISMERLKSHLVSLAFME